MKKIIISSDSTVAKYGNRKNVFLVKKFATEKKIPLGWLFSEAHYGKYAADGVGGNIENKVKDLVNMNTEYDLNPIVLMCMICACAGACKNAQNAHTRMHKYTKWPHAHAQMHKMGIKLHRKLIESTPRTKSGYQEAGTQIGHIVCCSLN